MGKNVAKQGRTRRSKHSISENVERNSTSKFAVSKNSNESIYHKNENSTQNKIYVTENKHINYNQENMDEYSNFGESSNWSQSQRENSATRKELVANDPMWEFYPKQVQNVLKKKRIDRDRLKRSLKTPGRRNYKTLFANLQKVWAKEGTYIYRR